MMRTIHSEAVEIEAPASRVFDYVIDRANYPRWFPGILEMEQIDDRAHDAEGTRFRETAILPTGKRETVRAQTVSVDRRAQGGRFVMVADLATMLPHFTYDVEPLAADRSRFTFTMRARGTGAKAWAMSQAAKLVMRRRAGEALRRLKTIVEAKPGTLMRTAEMFRFGTPDEALRINDEAIRPRPARGELLIEIDTSSVNPIEVRRRDGYGAILLKLRGGLTWPVVLGSDAYGQVAAVGDGVQGWRPGDAVLAVKGISSTGTHAGFATVPATQAIRAEAGKPDLAGLPYAFLTAWAALVEAGGLTRENAPGTHVFVNGGSGGVGTVAIQLAKAWGARVSTSCATDAVNLCERLGADRAIDYRSQPPETVLDGVDIVLDAVGAPDEPALAGMLKLTGTFVTLVHPTLALADTHGVPAGLWRAKREQRRRAKAVPCQTYRWVLFKPDRAGLEELRRLLEAGRIVPVTHAAFALEEIAHAHRCVEAGHLRGKVLLTADRSAGFADDRSAGDGMARSAPTG